MSPITNYMCVDNTSVEFMRSSGVGKIYNSDDASRFYYQYGERKDFYYPPPYSAPNPLPQYDAWVGWNEFYSGTKLPTKRVTWEGGCTEWKGVAGDDGW